VPVKEGVLSKRPSGQWAICWPGFAPVEIEIGEEFLVEVDGLLRLTRMEFWHHDGPLKGREYESGPGEYFSVHGYELRHGLRAAFHRQ
jgi:hypothetical protein